MSWLPQIFKSSAPVVQSGREVEIAQTKAVQELASGVTQIAEFLSGGGLSKVLGEYSKSQIAKDILGGLAAHSGREALDARFIQQNALEIIHTIESVFDKAKERGEALARGEVRDSELKNAESEFLEWKDVNKAR